MRVRVDLCNNVLSHNCQRGRFLRRVLFMCWQFCSSLYLVIEVFLDSNLLSIEDQVMLYVQPGSHKYV